MDLKSKDAHLGWSRRINRVCCLSSIEGRADHTLIFMMPACVSLLVHRARVNEAATRAPFQPRPSRQTRPRPKSEQWCRNTRRMTTKPSGDLLCHASLCLSHSHFTHPRAPPPPRPRPLPVANLEPMRRRRRLRWPMFRDQSNTAWQFFLASRRLSVTGIPTGTMCVIASFALVPRTHSLWHKKSIISLSHR